MHSTGLNLSLWKALERMQFCRTRFRSAKGASFNFHFRKRNRILCYDFKKFACAGLELKWFYNELENCNKKVDCVSSMQHQHKRPLIYVLCNWYFINIFPSLQNLISWLRISVYNSVLIQFIHCRELRAQTAFYLYKHIA